MDVVLKREVTGVGIWLPLEEAVQFLRNPKKVLQEVETMLRSGGGVDPSTGRSLGTGFPAEKQVAFLPRPGGTIDVDAGTSLSDGRGKGRRPYSRPDRLPPSETVRCEHCGKTLKKGAGIARHITVMHREVRDAERDAAGER